MSKIKATVRDGFLIIAKPLESVARKATTSDNVHLVSPGGHKNVALGDGHYAWVKVFATTDVETAETLGLIVDHGDGSEDAGFDALSDVFGETKAKAKATKKASKAKASKRAGSLKR